MQPGAVGAGLGTVTVSEDPFVVNEVNTALVSGETIFLDLDLAFLGPSYQ